MKFTKILTLLMVALVVSGCSLLPKTLQGPSGQIAFGVDSVQSTNYTFPTNLAVELRLQNRETGKIYKRYFEFEAGRRVEYLSQLSPGRYVTLDYTFYSGDGYEDSYEIEPAVEVEIKADQTTLFPMSVGMSAIYPSGSVQLIRDENFWDDYSVEK
jgi:hypothetical protein